MNIRPKRISNSKAQRDGRTYYHMRRTVNGQVIAVDLAFLPDHMAERAYVAQRLVRARGDLREIVGRVA